MALFVAPVNNTMSAPLACHALCFASAHVFAVAAPYIVVVAFDWFHATNICTGILGVNYFVLKVARAPYVLKIVDALSAVYYTQIMKDRMHIWVARDASRLGKASAASQGLTLEAFVSQAIIEKVEREGTGLRAKVKKMTRKKPGAI